MTLQGLKGIHNLIRYEVPFAIAPTIHEGNLHEINDIVRFAYGNGGFFASNHLRKFPLNPPAPFSLPTGGPGGEVL